MKHLEEICFHFNISHIKTIFNLYQILSTLGVIFHADTLLFSPFLCFENFLLIPCYAVSSTPTKNIPRMWSFCISTSHFIIKSHIQNDETIACCMICECKQINLIHCLVNKIVAKCKMFFHTRSYKPLFVQINLDTNTYHAI